MKTLSDLFYKFKAIPIKILGFHFIEINKLCLKLMWNCKAKTVKIMLGRTKLEHSYSAISKLTEKLQNERECGTSIRTFRSMGWNGES